MLVPPAPPLGALYVSDDRLRHDTGEGPRPFERSDFVLLGIHGKEYRDNESRLPFYRLRNRAFRAVADGEESWQRAKGYLISAYQEMSDSPDITHPVRTLADQGDAQPRAGTTGATGARQSADALDRALARINGFDPLA
jgi:hypothetical protein